MNEKDRNMTIGANDPRACALEYLPKNTIARITLDENSSDLTQATLVGMWV